MGRNWSKFSPACVAELLDAVEHFGASLNAELARREVAASTASTAKPEDGQVTGDQIGTRGEGCDG